MKLRSFAPAFLVFLAPLVGAAQNSPLKFDHFPLEVGMRWTYRARDLKSLQAKTAPVRKVVVEVAQTESYLEKQTKDGKDVTVQHTGFLLKSTSQGKSTFDHVVVLPEGVFRVHAARTKITPPLLFFKVPRKLGETWTCDSVSGNTTIKGTFVANRDRVTVPMGIHDALIISYRSQKAPEEQIEIDYWFVRDIGMVKQRVRTKTHEVVLELEKFDKGK
ncbi:MAG: hypothetical protein HYX68_23440 [Planctomycetes bacterium]|nr:hypothetical protein [Planctomycetota bacterium]